jgi:hypothetical protein
VTEDSTGSYMNRLPGVPHVESPFFSDLFPAAAQDDTSKIARIFHRDGVARIRFRKENFDPVADAAIADMREQFGDQIAHVELGDPAIQDGWRTSRAVRQIANNSQVLRLLERLYGRRPFPFRTVNFPSGSEQHFHSDALHFSSVPERFMCAVWVALEDVTLENGPLVYYPGSHRWPIFTNEHVNHCQALSSEKPSRQRFHAMWEELVRANGVVPQRFVARKGEALIWAANLLHGGDLHRDRSLSRWAQLTYYFFDACAYYSPISSDPFMGLIDFLNPVDIGSGETVRPCYGGVPLPQRFVEAARWLSATPEKFDPELYLLANPDVAQSGINPLMHFLMYGRFENRRVRPAD